MLIIIKLLIGSIGAYLLGSFPTAYIAGKMLKGIDIREHGSKNVGATNVFRVLGKGPGLVVLIIDILKGFLAVVVISRVLGLDHNTFFILLGVSSVVGHNWTIFLQFKGGKGVATSLGVLIGLTVNIVPLRFVLVWLIIIWAVVFLVSGYVSLASMLAVFCLPFIILMFSQEVELVVLGVIFCAFILLRHQANIRRLMTGKESRVFSFPAWLSKRKRFLL
jgi:acyl phosphate:glycerol-3-phosphate acyltransferase